MQQKASNMFRTHDELKQVAHVMLSWHLKTCPGSNVQQKCPEVFGGRNIPGKKSGSHAGLQISKRSSHDLCKWLRAFEQLYQQFSQPS